MKSMKSMTNRIRGRSISTLATAVALAAAAFTLSGCKTKLVGIAPSISVTPATIAFGQSQIGASKQATISITNAGSAPLEVTTVKVATDPNHEMALFGSLATDCAGNVRDATAPLAPSECAQVTVKWTPKAAHAASGSVEIDSNDTANSVVIVPISGTSIGPQLQYCVLTASATVDPAACSNLSAATPVKPAVDFGAGTIATPVSRIVRLTNQGAAALNFTAAPALTGSSDFSLAGTIESDGGQTLAPGATTDLTVTATPSAPGTITGGLALASNDPYAPALSIPLTITLAPFPSISATPAMLAYPAGTIGVATSLPVNVTNVGGAPLMISAIKISLDPNMELKVVNLLTTDCTGAARAVSSTLAAGECARFDVAWTPSANHAASGAVEIDSDDPQHAAITIPVGSQMGTGATSALLQACVLSGAGTVNPANCTVLSAMPAQIPTVDFGATTVNSTTTRTVQLKNTGTAALTFSPAPGLDSTGSAIFTLTSALGGNTLAAGATANLTITAKPTAAGTLTSALVIDSNDQYAPAISLPITLTAATVPVISVSPAALVYGPGTIGTASKLAVKVSNIGTAPLTISAIKASANTAELSVINPLTTDCTTGAARAGGLVLAVGECGVFTAAWTPSGNHVASGAFEVDSNDPASPAVTLPVSSSTTTGATSALLQACVLSGGVVVPAQCTNLGAATPVIPTANFGAIAQGASGTQTIRLTNQGTAPLMFAPAPALTGSTDYKMTATVPGNTIAPGAYTDLPITVTPSVLGTITGAMTLVSNDQFQTHVSLPLTASTTAPLLQVCVLSTGACTDLSATPHSIPSVNFGMVQPGVTAAPQQVKITNTGNGPLSLTSPPTVTTSTSPVAFTLTGSSATPLAAGASVTLTINAVASSGGTLAGSFNVYSNDARQTLVQLPISMTVPTFGFGAGCTVASNLAFGSVNVGSSLTKTVQMTNCGQTPLTVNSFTISGTNAARFTMTGGASIPVGGTITLNVVYAPTAVETDTAAIAYSFAAASATVSGSIALSGNGILAACGTSGRNPVAVIGKAYYTSDQSGAASPNPPYTLFTPSSTTATNTPVLPLDYVMLDGSASTYAPGTGPLTYTWSLSQPSGSQTSLIDAGATTKLWALVSGAYTVTLSVTDATNCSSTTSTSATFYVASKGTIHIELTWEEGCGDLDLHYVAPGDNVCWGNDVFYADLPGKPYYGPGFPDWGCTSSSCSGPQNPGGMYPDHTSADDATLDHDNVTGYGPENVTQAKPFNSPSGSPYQVWVYYYDDHNNCDNTHPTVNIYVDGVLNQSYTYSDSKLGNEFVMSDLWHVANIAVAGDVPVVSQPAINSQLYSDYNSDVCLCEYPGDDGYPQCPSQ